MNQNDCNLGGDSDSNDVVSSTVLNTGNANAVDEHDLFNAAGLNHDQANLLAAAVASAGHSNSNGAGFLSDDEELPHFLREQDRFLPIANVAKLMKKAIPERGKIAKEAKECVQECVSEFISFITSEAVERCSLEKRKTINGEDILFAMSNLGFDNYVEPLKIYLTKYRESNKVSDTSRLNPNDFSQASLSDVDHHNQQQQHHQQHNMHHQINY